MATQMFKIKKIKEAAKDRNIDELKNLAKKHGFINNKLRKQVWPILLGIKTNKKYKLNKSKSSSNLKRRKIRTNKKTPPITSLLTTSSADSILSNTSSRSNKSNHDQIEKDIARSALNFYNINETQSQSQTNLGRILHSMFDESHEMHYIQGFNDVVSVFYAVCGSHDLAKKLSKKVAKTLLKDYIMNGYEELNLNAVQQIFKIISYHDRQLHTLFCSINAHILSFCVSWLITWFAHEIKDINTIARIYDYALCSHELISLYLSAALLLHFKKELLSSVIDDVTLHCFFQELKWERLDFNKVISISEELFSRYPPSIISPRSYSMSSIMCGDDECDEIKEEIGESSDSGSEYNSDIYTPSVGPSEDITPLVDPIEEMATFHIDEDKDTKQREKGKTETKQKKFSVKKDLLFAFHSFEDKLEKTIDDFVAIFDTKSLEKESKK